MKIVFLNAWHGKTGQKFLDFIKTESKDTDIFCLQEVDPQLLEKIQNILSGSQLYYDTDGIVGIYGVEYGQAVFIKKDIQVVNNKRVDYFKNIFNDLGFAQCIKVVKNDKNFYIVNVHGKAHPGHKKDTPARLRQSRVIIDYLNNLSNPKIIGGDFNLSPDTKSIRLFEKEGYKNLIKDFNIKSTRNKIAWENFKDKPGFVRQYFADYCLVSPEIKVHSFKVPDIEVSDHLPLVLDFEL